MHLIMTLEVKKMFRLEDYLEYYKDVSLDDVSINDLDLAFFTTLSYMPIDPFDKEKKLHTIIKECNEVKDKNLLGGTAGYSIKLLNIIKHSKRFKDLVFSNYVNIINSQTQFSAIKIKFDKNTIISYKGTDNSLIGWKEDFRLSFMYPVYTQGMAKKYLTDNIGIFDNNIYVIGHSKGGNLAISASMEVNNSINKKIKRIVNFDGPGLLDKEYNSDKFKKIKDRLINYLPENSVVGILMNNIDYYIVKSEGIGFACHNIANWFTYGTFFQKGELSNTSKKLHENNLLGLKQVNPKEIEKVIETFYAVVENNDIHKFSDIRKMNFSDIIKTINDLSDVSSETKKYFMESMKTFMMPKKKENK